MEKKNLVIFGTGQFAEIAHFYFTNDSPYRVVAFTVDADHLKKSTFLGLPVVPFETIEDSYSPADYKMFIAVAYAKLNTIRIDRYVRAKEKGYTLPHYISSRAVTWQNAPMAAPHIGENSFILENQTIQPFCSIGNNTILWSGNHIGHHSTIGDHCFLASHIVVSGNVTVGDQCFIGVNATLRDGITVGSGSIIGAGALIMHDVGPGEVYKEIGTKKYERSSSQIRL